MGGLVDCYSINAFVCVCVIVCVAVVDIDLMKRLTHSYRTFVSEDAGPNTLVATVLAKDPDGDGIGYSITDGNTEGNFVIDSQKGTTKLLVTTQTLSDLPSNQRVSP